MILADARLAPAIELALAATITGDARLGHRPGAWHPGMLQMLPGLLLVLALIGVMAWLASHWRNSHQRQIGDAAIIGGQHFGCRRDGT